jgi:hypothetical protein
MKNKLVSALFLGGVLASSAALAVTVTSVLPTPGNSPGIATYGTYRDATGTTRDAILINGIPVAFKYDSFWSYSMPVLGALQNDGFLPAGTYGSYSFATGVGGLDVVLTTQAGGTTNQNVGPAPGYDFQDPVDLNNGDQIRYWNGAWGGDPQTYSDNTGASYTKPAAGIGGVVTVGNLLDYLHALNPANNIPVFFADWNQKGSADSLFFNGYAEILDGSNNAVKTWYLDTLNNNSWDPTAQTFNFGSVSFCSAATFATRGAYDPVSNPTGCAGVTANGSDYLDLNHNKGSGKPDFTVFSDTMNLSLYNPTYTFRLYMNLGCGYGALTKDAQGNFILVPNDKDHTLGCNTNGAEELFLSGRVATSDNPPQPTPEPGILALFGLGLVGLSIMRRRTI